VLFRKISPNFETAVKVRSFCVGRERTIRIVMASRRKKSVKFQIKELFNFKEEKTK
jgi:hypothetical protein